MSSKLIELTITNVVTKPGTTTHFGFAASDDGEDYFLPRLTVLRNNLTPNDIGVRIRGRAKPKPAADADKPNYPHILPAIEFLNEDD